MPHLERERLRQDAERGILDWVVRYAALGFTPQAELFYTAQEIVRGDVTRRMVETGAVKPALRSTPAGEAEAAQLEREDG